MPRILYLITRADRGGAQTNVLALACGAKAAGHDVVVGVGSSGWLTEELARAGIAVHRFGGLERSWNPLAFRRFIKDAGAFLAAQAFDVLHVHSSHPIFALPWLKRAAPKVRTVATIHGWSVLHPAWRKNAAAKVLYANAMRLGLRSADRIVCVCERDRAFGFHAAFFTKDAPVEVIPNGINLETVFADRASARAELGLSTSDRFTVGTVARLDYAKNLGLLIQAVHGSDASIEAVVVGEGPERASLAREAGRDARVRFVGAHDARKSLRAFDLFVLSSRYEGFPYVLLEAALAGVPIVSTNVGGISECIEDGRTGWLVESGDADALARAIEFARTHPEERARVANAARGKVQQQYAASRMIERTLALYDSPTV